MTDILIASDADVQPALAKAKPGDVLVFAAGSYAPIRTIRRWDAPGITLRPATGAKVLLHNFVCDGAAGLTVEDFELDTREGVGFMMGGKNPERIVVRRCDIHGAIVEPDVIRMKGGIALSFGVNAVNCAMEDCEVHHTGSGINGIGGSGNRIVRNRIHDIANDAMHFAPGENLLVEGNDVRDIYAEMLAHLDGIQLTTVGVTVPPQGIVIRRNHLVRGKGSPFQGIFGNNEVALPYRGLIIEENLVSGGAYHGITMRLAEGPIIRNNYVTGDAGSLDGRAVMAPWIKLMDSKAVVVTDNICVIGPIFQTSTIANQKGNKNVRLPKAGDYSAAEAWWAKLPPRPTQAAMLSAGTSKLAQFAATAVAAQAMLVTPSTRRNALAQLLAQAALL